ncbi:hypothetical protein ACJJTC_017569 [Scirpophaga incertulas]
MQLMIKVTLYRKPYTIFYIYFEYLPLLEVHTCKFVFEKSADSIKVIQEGDGYLRRKLRLTASALFLQPFKEACLRSEVYRRNVLMNLHKLFINRETGTVLLNLKLEPPDKEIIDYAWNYRILRIVWTRVEIESAFSWLSTLGGAYSALGDYFEHCAEEAGRISITQYKLSKMLGDEGLAARSCLYSALSYSQKGNLKFARHIVRNVAEFAKKTHDKRLIRMCLGVWAKLKYLRSLTTNKRKQLQTCNGQVVN